MSNITPARTLRCGHRTLDLSSPIVMGVLNVTPDSFSDGGEVFCGDRVDTGRALARAQAMVTAGAKIIDIGGESTRPGAAPVSSKDEMDRVLPVVRALQNLDVVLSVDTSNPALMAAALAEGVGFINDVRALERAGALETVARSDAAVCLMHMGGEPGAMQDDPRYQNVVAEVVDYLAARAAACVEAGIDRSRLVIDPGLGFGKTAQHNLTLLAQTQALRSVALPVLVGISRKSTIGRLTGHADPKARDAGSLAAHVIAVLRGADIVRTHAVAATVDALRVVAAVPGVP